MGKQTVAQIAKEMADQEAAYAQEIVRLKEGVASLKQSLAAQIEASRPKAHIGHWLTGAGVAVALAMLIATLFFNLQAADRQTAAAEQQGIRDAKQDAVRDAQSLAQNCALMDQRAFLALKLDPRSAQAVFTEIQSQNAACEAVGVPLLARISYQIGNDPKGVPREVVKQAANVRATLPLRKPFSDMLDPDGLNYDQAKLRQYYLTQGYADFRVVSAVAELTPDKRDFIISYADCKKESQTGATAEPEGQQARNDCGNDHAESKPSAPRLGVGFGVDWNSPFGPFRIDVAKALLKSPSDSTKLFTFNTGTQF